MRLYYVIGETGPDVFIGEVGEEIPKTNITNLESESFNNDWNNMCVRHQICTAQG